MNPYDESNKMLFIPSCITMILHIYHVLMFKNIQFIDWVHHIVMCLILFTSFLYPSESNITNYFLFFINGLPGFIDYMALILVKYKHINKITEKQLNSHLNIWVRSPGIIIGIYILFLRYLAGLIIVNPIVISLIVIGLFWNAQYFSQRIVFNYGHHHTINIK